MRLTSSAPVVQPQPLTSHSFNPFKHSRVSKTEVKPNTFTGWYPTSDRCTTSLTKLMVLLLVIDCATCPPTVTSLYYHLAVKLSRCRPFLCVCLLCTTQHLMDRDRVFEPRAKLWSQETAFCFFVVGWIYLPPPSTLPLDFILISMSVLQHWGYFVFNNNNNNKTGYLQQKKTWFTVLEETDGSS